jgi:hypothetical protein
MSTLFRPLVLIGLLFPASAFASYVQSDVRTSISHSLSPTYHFDSSNSTTQVSVSESAWSQYTQVNVGDVYYEGQAAAVASTDYGRLKASVAAKGYSTEKYIAPLIVTADARSQFHDTLRITAEGVANGSAGVLSVDLFFYGEALMTSVSGMFVNDNPRGTTSMGMFASLGNSVYTLSSLIDIGSRSITSSNCTTDLLGNLSCRQMINYSGSAYFDATSRMDIPFIFGDQLDLRMSITTSIEGWARSTFDSRTGDTILNYFDAYADASHSAYWGGIQSVMVDGAETSYNVQSGSGTDYRQSFIPERAGQVPLPGTLSLSLIGLLALSLPRARRAASSKRPPSQGQWRSACPY